MVNNISESTPSAVDCPLKFVTKEFEGKHVVLFQHPENWNEPVISSTLQGVSRLDQLCKTSTTCDHVACAYRHELKITLASSNSFIDTVIKDSTSSKNTPLPEKLSYAEYVKALSDLNLEDANKWNELISLLSSKQISPDEFFKKQEEREIEYKRLNSEIEKRR